jgi:hypothetical protein
MLRLLNWTIKKLILKINSLFYLFSSFPYFISNFLFSNESVK